jgi:hypothetical protein
MTTKKGLIKARVCFIGDEIKENQANLEFSKIKSYLKGRDKCLKQKVIYRKDKYKNSIKQSEV